MKEILVNLESEPTEEDVRRLCSIHTEEQDRIKAQSIEEWIAEYSGEPVKQEQVNNDKDDNFGVEF